MGTYNGIGKCFKRCKLVNKRVYLGLRKNYLKNICNFLNECFFFNLFFFRIIEYQKKINK